MLRGNNGLKILLILLLGSIGVVYAKKDKEKNTAPKDSTSTIIASAITAEVATKDTAVAKVKAEKKSEAKTKTKTKTEAKAKPKTEPKEETEIKVDGILELGFDNQYRYGVYKNERVTYKRIGRAEIGASFRPVKKVRAEIGFEYNSKDSVPTIDKLYTQYNPLSSSTIRFGYMKKSFGLEERTGLDERYFHKRSIINDFLDSSGIGFLNHDLTLQYRHEIGKKFELRGGFSWTADSTRYLQNYSAEYDDKKNNIILAAIIKHVIPPDEAMITTYISSLSYRRIGNLSASEVELTYGTNPYIKRLKDRDATILGARLKENIFLNTGLNTLQQVIPIAEAAIFSRDFKADTTEYDAQFRAGLTLGFAKKSAFQWRNNYGVVSKIRDGERELWRRRFDTEVVVIF
ncbi:MAG: porin [Fibromonadales bacterium]|nr:porin [Fibromonadales bacterium]